MDSPPRWRGVVISATTGAMPWNGSMAFSPRVLSGDYRRPDLLPQLANRRLADDGHAALPFTSVVVVDRFWRSRQASQISGSGIGLAVAAELARAHGGQLTATSRPGRGTEMKLTLPRVPVASRPEPLLT